MMKHKNAVLIKNISLGIIYISMITIIYVTLNKRIECSIEFTTSLKSDSDCEGATSINEYAATEEIWSQNIYSNEESMECYLTGVWTKNSEDDIVSLMSALYNYHDYKRITNADTTRALYSRSYRNGTNKLQIHCDIYWYSFAGASSSGVRSESSISTRTKLYALDDSDSVATLDLATQLPFQRVNKSIVTENLLAGIVANTKVFRCFTCGRPSSLETLSNALVIPSITLVLLRLVFDQVLTYLREHKYTMEDNDDGGNIVLLPLNNPKFNANTSMKNITSATSNKLMLPSTTKRRDSAMVYEPSMSKSSWSHHIDDKSGMPYFYNEDTGESVWEEPEENNK